MSDWLREVEHASYSVQYTGPESMESNPLLPGQARESRCVRFFWILFLFILFGVGTGIGCYLLLEEEPEWPINVPYVLMTREDWRARPAARPILQYTAPLTHVQITQTGTDDCAKSNDCANLVRAIQADHVKNRKLSDIAYNFIIGGDGIAYEGRGWNLKPDLVPDDISNRTLMVAVLGTFDYIQPPRHQMQEVKILLQEAINRSVLEKCFSISLFKQRPQDGGGQMMHVFNKLVTEIYRRRQLFKCI